MLNRLKTLVVILFVLSFTVGALYAEDIVNEEESGAPAPAPVVKAETVKEELNKTASGALDKVHHAWGFNNGEEIMTFKTRTWFSKGDSRFELCYEPATFEATGGGTTSMDFDDLEVTVQYLELEMRVPYVRSMRVFGGVNLMSMETQRGVYTEKDWDNEINDPNRAAYGHQHAESLWWSRSEGECKVSDLDDWELNIGLIVMGKDAAFGNWGKQSSLMLYFGYRSYSEDIDFYQGTQALASWAPAQQPPVFSFEDAYKLRYNCWQFGVVATTGFGDMLPGLSGKFDFAYMTGDFKGVGVIRNSTQNYSDDADAHGWSLRAGLEYRWKQFSIEAGHEWLWLKGSDGHSNISGNHTLGEVKTDRMGFYLSLGWSF